MQKSLTIFDRIYPDLDKALDDIINTVNDDDDDDSKGKRKISYINSGFEAIYANKILMLHQLKWYLIREDCYPEHLQEVNRWLSDINDCNNVSEMLAYFDEHIPIYTKEYSEKIGIAWDSYSIRASIPFKKT